MLLRFRCSGRDFARRLDRLDAALHELKELLMSQLDDLKAAVAAEDANIEQVLQLVATETAQIADLQQKLADAIAAGSPDLSGLIADVQARTAALAAALPQLAPAPAPAADSGAAAT